VFEAFLAPRARWFLLRMAPTDAARVWACIRELEQNPFPGPDRRTALVTPGLPAISDAYHCHRWAIAFRVDAIFVVVEAIGPVWPPRR
jgi:hypothetical protein